MRTVLTLFLIIVIAISCPASGYNKYSIGVNSGYTTFVGGSPPWFTLDMTYGGSLGLNLSNKWEMMFDFSYFKVYDDSSAHSEFKFGSDKKYRLRSWQGYRLALLFNYRIFPHPSRLGFNIGLGGGITDWKITDDSSGNTLMVSSERGENIELASTEILINTVLGVEYRIQKHFMLGFDLQWIYLPGLGREFSFDVENNLSKWNPKIDISLKYLFGDDGLNQGEKHEFVNMKSSKVEISPAMMKLRMKTDNSEGRDSDGDGVPDAGDDCPETPSMAWGLVDIRGCPIDTDCDGFPNYIDSCPDNPIGSLVDMTGCPLDSDKDGVPDGLDDCPLSDPTLAVDESGCIDLSSLAEPLILNIKYHSGSFEVDHKTQQTLKDLSIILLKAPGVKIEINGYTDNIGTSDANKGLSQKRANRIRGFLIELGISTDRLISMGRGETNFIASNSTKKGRQKNRRVELVFFK